MTMLVRIKPYNPKRGQLARRIVIGGFRFDVDRGWYEVDDEFAADLKTKTQGGDPNAALIFDVCTAEEAKALQRSEDRAAQEAARADKPIKPERVERVRGSAPEGKVTTTDIVTKSETPIVADGADGDDDLDEDEEGDGRVAAVGRLAEEPKAKSRRKS